MSDATEFERGATDRATPDRIAQEQVWELLAADQPRRAVERSRRGLQHNPENQQLLLGLAFGLWRLGESFEARRHVLSFLRSEPEHPLALLVHGHLLLEEGQHAKAEEVFLRGLRSDPEEVQLLIGYAALMQRTGRFEKAEGLLLKARSLAPELEQVRSQLALLHTVRDQHAQAVLEARRSVELAPSEDHAHAALALSLFQSGHPFQARNHMREALRLDPSDAELRELYLEIDRHCRWIGLPMYFYNRWVKRLPGHSIGLWFGFLALVALGEVLPIPPLVRTLAVFGYIGLCLYTWLSRTLMLGWTKLVRPK